MLLSGSCEAGYATCNQVSGMLIALGKPGLHVVNRATAEMLLVEHLSSPGEQYTARLSEVMCVAVAQGLLHSHI